ncbi:MAG: hypothetical protein ABWY19_16055 [Marmoricola sp.]
MPTPQEPEDEPVGDELPDEPADKLSDEDALWRSIIDNYGERPTIDEPEIEAPPSLRDLDAPAREVGEEPEPVAADPEEHFVPPVPPPLPKPPPARLLAWTGLFGVPAFVLVALVAGLDLAPWMGLILMVWFVGGFVFLVASMRPGPGDDYDDGARL